MNSIISTSRCWQNLSQDGNSKETFYTVLDKIAKEGLTMGPFELRDHFCLAGELSKGVALTDQEKKVIVSVFVLLTIEEFYQINFSIITTKSLFNELSLYFSFDASWVPASVMVAMEFSKTAQDFETFLRGIELLAFMIVGPNHPSQSQARILRKEYYDTFLFSTFGETKFSYAAFLYLFEQIRPIKIQSDLKVRWVPHRFDHPFTMFSQNQIESIFTLLGRDDIGIEELVKFYHEFEIGNSLELKGKLLSILKYKILKSTCIALSTLELFWTLSGENIFGELLEKNNGDCIYIDKIGYCIKTDNFNVKSLNFRILTLTLACNGLSDHQLLRELDFLETQDLSNNRVSLLGLLFNLLLGNVQRDAGDLIRRFQKMINWDERAWVDVNRTLTQITNFNDRATALPHVLSAIFFNGRMCEEMGIFCKKMELKLITIMKDVNFIINKPSFLPLVHKSSLTHEEEAGVRTLASSVSFPIEDALKFLAWVADSFVLKESFSTRLCEMIIYRLKAQHLLSWNEYVNFLCLICNPLFPADKRELIFMNRENIIEILSKGVCINYETITQLFDENSIKDSFERLKSIQEGVSYAYKIPLNLFFDQFYTNTEVFCRFQLKRIYRMETVVVQKLTGKKGKRFYVKPTKHQKYMHSTKPLAFDLHKRLIALLLMQIEGMAVT